jgi:acyl-CoA thioester hydrolase
VVHRRVRWGECDPAEVVYTPQFAHYVVAAVDDFFHEIVGCAPYAPSSREGVGFPLRALAFEFSHFLTTGDCFEMKIRVTALRQRSFDLRVEASCGGRAVFQATYSPVCVDMRTKRATELPTAVRRGLTDYARATEGQPVPNHEDERVAFMATAPRRQP